MASPLRSYEDRLTMSSVGVCWLSWGIVALATFVFGQTCIPMSCRDLQCFGYDRKPGPYNITSRKGRISTQVQCDFVNDGGGWTLFMVRNTGALNFSAAHHGWSDFSRGFGNLSREFWLGNTILHNITHDAPYELRVELVAMDDDVRTANYRRFILGDEQSHFTMVVEKFDQSSSDAGDWLGTRGYRFTTPDNSNNTAQYECSRSLDGGWWFMKRKPCVKSYLTGSYGKPGVGDRSCMHWYGVTGLECLKAAKMMVRETDKAICDNPCSKGVCANAGTTYKCLCDEGYVGKNCEFVDKCTREKGCENGGTCLIDGTCKCAKRFTGLRCEVKCPCMNGGECDIVNTLFCNCPQGTTGKRCETVLEKINYERIALIVGGVVGIVFIIGFFVVIALTKRRRRRNQKREAELKQKQSVKSNKSMRSKFEVELDKIAASWEEMKHAAKFDETLSSMSQSDQFAALAQLSEIGKASLSEATSSLMSKSQTPKVSPRSSRISVVGKSDSRLARSESRLSSSESRQKSSRTSRPKGKGPSAKLHEAK